MTRSLRETAVSPIGVPGSPAYLDRIPLAMNVMPDFFRTQGAAR
jgi:hypothetical protein